MRRSAVLMVAVVAASTLQLISTNLLARPYPAHTGLAASADSPATAGSNPAGLARLNSQGFRASLNWFDSNSTWQGTLGDTDIVTSSSSDSTTLIPGGAYVHPISEKWTFGVTILGAAFSQDYSDEWVGRYIFTDYDLLYVSAYPSLAYQVNDRFSIAASIAATYSTYDQESVAYSNNEGIGNGTMEIDSDGTTFGLGLSALYEISDRTRIGISYQPELDAELDGKAKFGFRSQPAMGMSLIPDKNIEIKSRSPQSVLVGLYHESDTGKAVTIDVAWVDFSEFKLSELFFDGNQVNENPIDYDDIWAMNIGYSMPLNDRWMLGLGALYLDEMTDKYNRSVALRLDSLWVLGAGVEWQWKQNRTLALNIGYYEMGDGAIVSTSIPAVGAMQGKYTERETIGIELALNWTLSRKRGSPTDN